MKASRRIDDIEVLRGFAVIFVVLHHLNGSLYRFRADSTIGEFYSWFGGGAGVDLFFAISGFVIARSVLPSFDHPLSRQQFKQIAFSFWLRRIFRLLPSAWLWLAIILVLQVVFNESGVFGTLWANLKSTAAAVLQIANIRFALAFGQENMGASFVYWSLSLEEQFYLVFPFIALLSRRLLVSALILVIGYQLFQPRFLWEMMFRTDAICFGVLIAIMQGGTFYNRMVDTAARHRYLFAAALAVAIAAVGISDGEQLGLAWYSKSYVAVFSFLAVLIASFNLNLASRIFPLHRLLLWTGGRSYAIYLIHIPAFYVIREIFFRLGLKTGDYLAIAVVAAFLLIAACAQLNFQYVETPLRRWGASLAQRKYGKSV